MTALKTTIPPISRVQIARYAGATGDFNPIHVDEAFATQVAQLPSVIAHGPLVMSLTLDRILAAIQPNTVRSFDGRLREVTRPGDQLEVIVDEEGTVTVTNQTGAVVLTGQVAIEHVAK